MEPSTMSAAIEMVVELLKKQGQTFGMPERLNHWRYAVVPGRNGTPNIAIIRKTDWFHKFAEIAHENGYEESGIGDSINCDDLKFMLTHSVEFIYIVNKDKTYFVSMSDFLNKSFRWVNKENKEVRSISIHAYQRLRDEPMSPIEEKFVTRIMQVTL